jgi:hypothetical protein
MSEEQLVANKPVPNKITAEYLRSIGPNRRQLAQQEFDRIAPTLEECARLNRSPFFEITVSKFIYSEFSNILKECGFFNISTRDVNVLGSRRVIVKFEW